MASHSGEMVKTALRDKGMTQVELARRIGRDQTLISRYLSGQIEISVEAARSIAEVLGIDFEELRRQLQIDKYNRQVERLEAGFREILEVANVAVKEISDMPAVPLLDFVPAGAPDQLEKKAKLYVLPPGVQVDTERSFALKVSGENMTDDKVDEGDIIVVDPSAEVRDDDRVLVILSGEPALRRIYQVGETIMLLSPESREEPVIFLSQKNDFEIVGRVALCIKHFVR